MLPKLQFTDSLSKKKTTFTPEQIPQVNMYVCGITPYDHAHLGHARCYVAFDTLARFLRLSGYSVTYVRNYTDIDDKIINKAEQLNLSIEEVANTFIKSYQEDMNLLNCLPPTIEPRVTTHIQEIISLIEKLITKGHAYVLDHDVYFDITTYHSYGSLSGKKLDDLIAGSRVAVNTTKKNPGDFALWKGNATQEFWASPWGYGRPGWHIECSAMAYKHLGATIDIHGGGMDLMFPHHENEIAQSECFTGQKLANLWLHNAFININKEKMSKSLGNAINLKKVFESIDPMVLRFYFLQHHYRTPLDFNFTEFEGIKTAYKKLCTLTAPSHTSSLPINNHDEYPIITMILQALRDDLNTSKALGIIFEHLNVIKQDKTLCHQIVIILQDVLGLTLTPISEQCDITPKIALLLQEREEARKNKDWAKADALRSELAQLGYAVQDKKI
ncbi:cysteine--tRNA ligase [Candidatus Dependentiae bacterium]|nr:cysteine--tRNA ligase [Candidatus Dependentiae bacterium]